MAVPRIEPGFAEPLTIRPPVWRALAFGIAPAAVGAVALAWLANLLLGPVHGPAALVGFTALETLSVPWIRQRAEISVVDGTLYGPGPPFRPRGSVALAKLDRSRGASSGGATLRLADTDGGRVVLHRRWYRPEDWAALVRRIEFGGA